MFQVRVTGLRFHGNHGVYPSEKTAGNEFQAEVVALVDGRADQTDRLEDTVDYSALAGLLLELSDANKFDTVERLAGAYCEAALSKFSSVQEITINLDKIAPPGMTSVDSCGVNLHIIRSALSNNFNKS